MQRRIGAAIQAATGLMNSKQAGCGQSVSVKRHIAQHRCLFNQIVAAAVTTRARPRQPSLPHGAVHWPP